MRRREAPRRRGRRRARALELREGRGAHARRPGHAGEGEGRERVPRLRLGVPEGIRRDSGAQRRSQSGARRFVSRGGGAVHGGFDGPRDERGGGVPAIT